MKVQIILLTLLLAMCATTSVMADGKFYGNVAFNNCSCALGYFDVRIKSFSGIWDDLWPLLRCIGVPKYDTGAYTYPSGWYYISVVIHDGTNCDHTYIETVNHGSADQEVNLDVYGPDNPGNRPPGP